MLKSGSEHQWRPTPQQPGLPDAYLHEEKISRPRTNSHFLSAPCAPHHERSSSRPARKAMPCTMAQAELGDQEAIINSESEEHEHQNDYEVHWEEDDPANPHSMTSKRKWIIVSLIMTEFNCSRTVATLGLSFYIAGLGWGPVVMSPLSEFYGRRPIYLVSLPLYIVFLIPCAAAHNIQTMLVARFLDGLAGAAFTSVAGATVGDMYTKSTLHTPMLLYTASPFTGASIGPILGGLINSWALWRWSFYVLLIWSSIQSILVIIFVPETYAPVLLRSRARKLRQETGDDRWRAAIEKMDRSVLKTVLHSLYRPFMLLLMEPMCLNLCLLSSIALGVQYLFFGAFGVVYGNAYNFELCQSGLAFTGLLVGMIMAVLIDPWCCKIYPYFSRGHKEEGNTENNEPESRLAPAVIGAPLMTIGLFWFGWTAFPSVHWIAPIIGSAVFGAGMIFVFQGVFTFFVDAYPLYAASALGANSFTRSTFAAAFPLFGVAMYHKLGDQWATSLLAFLSLAMAPFPYIFFKYGKKIRSRSRFAT
ncbi:MFS transporter [Aspergillus eucalypticola CBS 122712]|uniref:MFS transporter n=1 Tax=Aspergillus eucalypticola (strain CBS 122712 / IBT 29274) TaxID=1448314 RepID=A0A317VLX3_ASPEC|nr:MFS transporter [Aspergillus eucalypticola CBS 122712]PWY74211.1 MFS transporter [Aspergillus eucalypticola CBS 122712]